MSPTIATALKAIDEIQARLDNLLDLLERSTTHNLRLARELREAHLEIAALERERDTWRTPNGR